MTDVVVLLALPAHGPDGLSDHATRWTFAPWWLALLVASTVLYARGVSKLRRRGARLRTVEPVAFAGAWLALIVALMSPLDALSDVLFAAHMSQHELLMLVAAPLFVMGRPLVAYLWGLPPSWRNALVAVARTPVVRAGWRTFTDPVVVLVLHGFVRWIWHAPPLWEAALVDERVHAFQHATFFFSAALFWQSLVAGRYGRVGYGVAVAFVFATGLHAGLLGALITFASRVWYPLHVERVRGVGVDPLVDQQLAGLIMWIPAGLLFLVLGLGLFAAWMGEASRRARTTRVARLAGRTA